tara:strand:+ start:2864 stop:2989 length:126 start_codon:yes stop_codon:yes gene_type:complete
MAGVKRERRVLLNYYTFTRIIVHGAKILKRESGLLFKELKI